jgi:hypothetical protein
MMTNMLEKLMALLDGELVASEGAAVIREAAREDSLAGMLEICAATARSRVGRPFAVIAATPAPAYMVDMIMRAPITTPAIERARQPSHSRTLLSRLKKRYQVPGWTLAAPAMAALLVAAGIGWLLLPTLDQGLRMEANLGAALEAAGSEQDFTLALLKPVLTFKNNDGAWCRQFEVRYRTKQISFALACRTGTGNWPVVAVTPLVPLPDGKSFAPASTNSARKAIDDRATSMRNGEPVVGPEEGELIKNGWPSLRG